MNVHYKNSSVYAFGKKELYNKTGFSFDMNDNMMNNMQLISIEMESEQDKKAPTDLKLPMVSKTVIKSKNIP